MKAVIIGDLGWNYLYHLGDEAMSVAAAGVLRGMGVEVTLVGGNPAPTTARYGFKSVQRPGFKKAMSYAEKSELLEVFTKALRGEAALPESAEPVVGAIVESDAVIIGGGGNLNSAGEHHLFDRVAMSRAASQYGKPLFVSSQTVGPALLEREVELVKEIAHNSVRFGAREPTTGKFMRTLVGDGKVYETMDDAILLRPAAPGKVASTVGSPIPDRYVIASFTHHVGTTEMSVSDYTGAVARLLDSIVAAFGVDVLMIPHLGKFAPAKPSGDQVFNSDVVSRSASGRVHAMPVLEADVALALTRDAVFTVSTRYHPVVFGPAVGTPAFGLQLSDYSVIRMAGALGNVGMSDFALPIEFLLEPDRFVSRAKSALSDLPGLEAHMNSVAGIRFAEQIDWWRDVCSIASGQPVGGGHFRHWVPEYRIR